MVEVRKYQLPPTKLIPNNPRPLLHYPNFFNSSDLCTAPAVHDVYKSNGWQTQWIFRYGPTQTSHYHSQAHECMTVLTGSATIRFGVADTSSDLEESTHGEGQESGGIELQANAGDVFVLPAGTAHKTFDTTPAEFALLTPGKAHGIEAEDEREALRQIELSGFTMIGSYPRNGGGWDFAKGGENEGEYEKVWNVPMPEHDPVMGDAEDGIMKTWQ